MQKTIPLVILFLLAACTQPKKEIDTKIKMYYYKVRHGFPGDTLPYKDAQPIIGDSLIETDGFEYRGKNHSIKFYTNSFHCNVDGEEDSYCLDSLGIIYLRSTTWPQYIMLKTNNDSINNLIQLALGTILLKPNLRSYALPQPVYAPPANK